MKPFTFLWPVLLLAIFSLISCDGRTRKHKSSVTVLKEKGLLDSFSEHITFYPETYSESETDTILSNGYRIHIKTFTDMKSHVALETKQGHLTHKEHYRNSIGQIKVFKQGREIFVSTIDKSLFERHSDVLSTNLNQYVLKSVWVDQAQTLSKNQVVVGVWYNKPKSNTYLYYRLLIDPKGQLNITKTS